MTKTEIIVTGDDQTGPTWDSVRQEAAQSIRAIAQALASGLDNITATSRKTANALTEDFGDAGREAGQALAQSLSSGMRDVAQDADRAGTQAGAELASGLADGVASGAGEIRAGARRALSGVEGEADDAGRDAGGALKERLAVGAAAAGAAVTTALVAGIDTAGVKTKLSAQLGGGEWAAEAGRIAGDVYGRGVVDSMGTAAEAVRAVWSQGLIPEDSSTAEIEAITAKVTNLSTAFDQELIPITRAAGKMLKTGLAETGGQALDILARGLGSNANEADDLMDTFSEYSTQFRKVGLSGEMALGLLSQALRGGARDSDIAADAIKEFALQSMTAIEKVDSKGRLQLTEVGAAFRSVGLDGYDAQADLAKGGAAAAGVLDKVLDGLRGIEDPIIRSQTAVALFGTQAEDLGDALYAMDPSTAVRAIGEVAGAADKVGKTMEAGPTAKIEAFKRSMSGAFTGAAEQFLTFASDHSTVMGPLAAGIGAMAVALGGAAAAMWVFNAAAAANPVVLVVGAIVVAVAGLVAALVTVWRTNDGVREAVSAGWTAIGSAVGGAVSIIGTGLTTMVAWFVALPGQISANAGRLPGIVGGAFSQMAQTAAYWTGYALGYTLREFLALPGRVWAGISALPGIVGQVLSWVASRAGAGASAAVSACVGQFRRLPGAAGGALSALPGIVQRSMSGAGRWLYEGGKNVVRGAINGIQSMAGEAYNAVADMGSSMVDGFRDAIGWHSPAKAFIPGGESIIDGLLEGLRKSRLKAITGIAGLGSTMVDATAMSRSARQRMLAPIQRLIHAPNPAGTAAASSGTGSWSSSSRGGAMRLIVEVRGGDGSSLDNLLIAVLRKRIRVEAGGNVQAALGSGGW